MSLTKGIVKMPNKSFRNAIKEAIESEMRAVIQPYLLLVKMFVVDTAVKTLKKTS